MPLSDLRELAPALKLDGANFFVVVKPDGHPKPVGIEFQIFNSNDIRPTVRLGVDGQNEVAVNGVFVAANERIDKLFERKRHAEERASEAREAAAPEPTWHKVAYNPYTVQIVVGLVLLAVGLVLGLLISSH